MIISNIVVNDFFLQSLKKYNIFQKRSGMKRGTEYVYGDRFKHSDTVFFSRDARIEEFSTFSSGNILVSSGSFSSLASSLPVGTRVGRYVSLAPGLKKMGFRHPIDAVCMNSAVFNFSRENIASYFSEYEKKRGTLNKTRVPTPQPHNKPINIGNDVWIGENVTIKGVSLPSSAQFITRDFFG